MGENKKSTAVCRVCLSYDFQREDGKVISLFEKYDDCVISDKINALANVGIKEGDGLPDGICPECLLELENAFKFKLKCERTNEVLLSAVNEAPSFDSNDGDLNDDELLLNMKEEYLDDVDGDNVELDDDNVELDDHITLADIKASRSLNTELPVAAPTKPSRAIDLKLICHDCGGSFKSKCKLRVHWKKVHLTENLKCANCLRTFKSFAALNSHKMQNLKSCLVASKVRIEGEGKSRIFHCKECGYHSRRIKDVGSHMVIHSGERPFQCDLCFKYFTQLSSVNAHKESAHKLYKAEGTCQHCGKYFKGRAKLYRHIRSHKKSSCPEGYPCKICKAVLKNKNSLYSHMKRHSGVKAYTCEVCPASFYAPSELWGHREKVHIKSKVYSCNICNYSNLSRYYIKKHMLKHTASNFGCNVCGVIVENEYQLELHQKRHTDRNYYCPHCDKTYYAKKNLLAHVRCKHKFTLNGAPASTRTAASKNVKGDRSAKS